jgi:hypothetical protein
MTSLPIEDKPAISLTEKVKQWVMIDKQIQLYQQKLKECRTQKAELTDHLCTYISSVSGKNSIALSTGELRMVERRDHTPLSFSYIEARLREIITDPDQAGLIIEYLKDKRELKTSLDIKYVDSHGRTRYNRSGSQRRTTKKAIPDTSI